VYDQIEDKGRSDDRDSTDTDCTRLRN
jgi:hypothetical protein